MESTPILSYTIALTLDNLIDFAFSPVLSFTVLCYDFVLAIILHLVQIRTGTLFAKPSVTSNKFSN